MKIGGIEGTPEEIKDTFENNGLHLEDYLIRPEAQLPCRWIIIPAISFAVVLVLLVLLAPLANNLLLLLFLLGVGCVIWLTVAIQVKYKNGWAASVIAIGCLLMILVAGGFIEPRETAQFLKELKK